MSGNVMLSLQCFKANDLLSESQGKLRQDAGISGAKTCHTIVM